MSVTLSYEIKVLWMSFIVFTKYANFESDISAYLRSMQFWIKLFFSLLNMHFGSQSLGNVNFW